MAFLSVLMVHEPSLVLPVVNPRCNVPAASQRALYSDNLCSLNWYFKWWRKSNFACTVLPCHSLLSFLAGVMSYWWSNGMFMAKQLKEIIMPVASQLAKHSGICNRTLCWCKYTLRLLCLPLHGCVHGDSSGNFTSLLCLCLPNIPAIVL